MLYAKAGFGLMVTFALAGCELATLSEVPGDPPPAIVQTSNGPTWVNQSSFAPVPPSRKAAGDQICRRFIGSVSGQRYVAAGYHPGALGADGRPLRGGGYLCLRP